jgi:hypothetical protein
MSPLENKPAGAGAAAGRIDGFTGDLEKVERDEPADGS